MIRILWAFACLLLTSMAAVAQPQNDTVKEDPYELTLEELMSIPIVSASKEKESSFAAPVTSFVITRKDMMNTGSTSIPEALRMAPGLIVRETANGVYDVSIRGGKDNLPSHSFTFMNNSILVMINNRPIFNYLSGGTTWQNLPVDIADVERIEIVYGPNAPLYGPNAVDGVINIITQKSEEKTYGTARFQAGNASLFSALIGGEISNKVNFNVSANYANRKRADEKYFDFSTASYINDLADHSTPDLASNPYLYFPEPEIASRHSGVNFNLYYTPAKNTTITLNTGYNSNLNLGSSGTYTNVSQQVNTNLNHMLKVESGNMTFQTSLIHGRHGASGNQPEQFQDYSTFDSYLDYNFRVSNKLSLRPAFSYQNAMIDDEPYTVDLGKSGVFNNKATMYNYAFSLKADYNPIPALRIIGAVRSDKFKAPDDTYISYQGIVNYKLNDNNIIRFLGGRSHAGSFIMPVYINLVLDDPFILVNVVGNEDFNLLQNNILELGYKTKLNSKVSLDVSVFRQSYRNYSAQLTRVVKEPSFAPPAKGELEFKQSNIGLESDQTGATVAATILLGQVTFKPSLTWQQNKLNNYSPYYAEPNPMLYPENNYEKVEDKTSEFTPDVFGGFAINAPVKKWNFNLTGYFYSAYKLNGIHEADVQTGALIHRDLEEVNDKVLLNANISYTINPKINVFLNGRNLLGQEQQEAYASEEIGRLFLAGVHIEL
ncbi:MAG TPA: TonB-dependent receptor [Ohtaekwangia sp.]|nr:TonB-dependent receptor [Ohtaekwangia sp.]